MLTQSDVIGRKYRLIDPLGEDGMGAAWVAKNISIRGAVVAVKVLRANIARWSRRNTTLLVAAHVHHFLEASR